MKARQKLINCLYNCQYNYFSTILTLLLRIFNINKCVIRYFSIESMTLILL